jgi:hypothetical protein
MHSMMSNASPYRFVLYAAAGILLQSMSPFFFGRLSDRAQTRADCFQALGVGAEKN